MCTPRLFCHFNGRRTNRQKKIVSLGSWQVLCTPLRPSLITTAGPRWDSATAFINSTQNLLFWVKRSSKNWISCPLCVPVVSKKTNVKDGQQMLLVKPKLYLAIVPAVHSSEECWTQTSWRSPQNYSLLFRHVTENSAGPQPDVIPLRCASDLTQLIRAVTWLRVFGDTNSSPAALVMLVLYCWPRWVKEVKKCIGHEIQIWFPFLSGLSVFESFAKPNEAG